MKWENLKNGTCPNDCNEPLVNNGGLVVCKFCDFKVRISKYEDLIKDKKDSKRYQQTVARYQRLKVAKKRQKDNLTKVFSDAKAERLLNLKRLLNRGAITKEEYDYKINNI
jgi:uncharacterized Zn finger protein (UPF0148 family)